jgi:hypothetical protein|uniref:Uncharacterized protein n=1 Tax=Zea mays TaxID=4577 RepID=B4FK46_MAIZE|nr:unknown [Zea mays]
MMMLLIFASSLFLVCVCVCVFLEFLLTDPDALGEEADHE